MMQLCAEAIREMVTAEHVRRFIKAASPGAVLVRYADTGTLGVLAHSDSHTPFGLTAAGREYCVLATLRNARRIAAKPLTSFTDADCEVVAEYLNGHAASTANEKCLKKSRKSSF